MASASDWRTFIESGGAVQDGRTAEQAVLELCEMLRSPDPVTRDELAYVALLRIVPRLEPPLRRRLGDTMAERFNDSEIQARTFAPLILAALVAGGDFDVSWLTAFEAWYPAESDLRGYDPDLGWLHAVAHGADLLGAFARSPHVERPDRLLDLAAARLLAKTDYVLRDQEDDRLAYAMSLTLRREELTETTSVAWLEPIADDFRAGEPGPVPAHASNTMRTLRMLYLLADRGRHVRHRDLVKERLAEVLALVAPFAD